MALLRLDRLGIPRFHRQSRHGDWLAAEGLWPVLELEDSPWQARPPGGAETRSPVDPYAQPRKIHYGALPTFMANCSSSASSSARPASPSTWSGTACLRHRPGGRSWDNHLKTMVSVDFF